MAIPRYSQRIPKKKPKKRAMRPYVASTISSSYCTDTLIGKGHLTFPQTNGSDGL